MSRAAGFFILLLFLLVGAVIFLSSKAEEVPTRTIEVDVTANANAD